MSTSQPGSVRSNDLDSKPSLLRNVSAKASRFHARVPYLKRLPFPAIAIILTLIIVNLVVWAAVGIILVR
jgi:high-affinity nickel-transport protein